MRLDTASQFASPNPIPVVCRRHAQSPRKSPMMLLGNARTTNPLPKLLRYWPGKRNRRRSGNGSNLVYAPFPKRGASMKGYRATCWVCFTRCLANSAAPLHTSDNQTEHYVSKIERRLPFHTPLRWKPPTIAARPLPGHRANQFSRSCNTSFPLSALSNWKLETSRTSRSQLSLDSFQYVPLFVKIILPKEPPASNRNNLYFTARDLQFCAAEAMKTSSCR